MRIRYKHKYDLTKPCVAKLWFGEKYLVLKSPDIKTGARQLIDAFETGILPADGLKVYVIPKVRRAMRDVSTGDNTCVVEIMLATERGAELMAREQTELNRRLPGCLNPNKTVDRPSWIYEYIGPREQPSNGLFTIKGRHRAAPAVVKLWVGEKFFIWKCMDIQQFPGKFSESMEVNIQRADPNYSGALNPLVKYMVAHPGSRGIIEVLYKGDITKRGVKKLLTVERNLLKKFHRQPGCLNLSQKSYVPQWIQEILNPKIIK